MTTNFKEGGYRGMHSKCYQDCNVLVGSKKAVLSRATHMLELNAVTWESNQSFLNGEFVTQ